MATKFLLNLVSRILPLTIAAVFAIYADNQLVKIISYGCGVVVLIMAEYFGIYRPLVNLEEYKKRLLDHYIDQFVKTAAIDKIKIRVRVNIMLVKWNWISFHFFQYYQNGMAGNSDSNIHFDVKKGFCGKCFNEKAHEVRFIDLSKLKKKTFRKVFKFSEEEFAATAQIKAIACIPLYRQVKTFRGNPKTEFFGVLNVDTTEANGIAFLKSPEIQELIKGLAGYVQLILV